MRLQLLSSRTSGLFGCVESNLTKQNSIHTNRGKCQDLTERGHYIGRMGVVDCHQSIIVVFWLSWYQPDSGQERFMGTYLPISLLESSRFDSSIKPNRNRFLNHQQFQQQVKQFFVLSQPICRSPFFAHEYHTCLFIDSSTSPEKELEIRCYMIAIFRRRSLRFSSSFHRHENTKFHQRA